jgi:hypothetical protein
VDPELREKHHFTNPAPFSTLYDQELDAGASVYGIKSPHLRNLMKDEKA